MKKIMPKIVATLATAFVTGCATIVAGGPSWLEMETSPTNVEVTLQSIQNSTSRTIVTPFKVELDKKSDYNIIVDTPNFRSEEVYIRRKVEGWFWGNIFLGGGPVGMFIDYATGDMWVHNPRYININLTSLNDAPDKVTLNIPVRMEYPNSSYETVFLPITFYKKGSQELSNYEQNKGNQLPENLPAESLSPQSFHQE
ncbi:MAG: hypothetical protein Fur0025_01950 [Oscillatoriaceae cyanobacterium]